MLEKNFPKKTCHVALLNGALTINFRNSSDLNKLSLASIFKLDMDLQLVILEAGELTIGSLAASSVKSSDSASTFGIRLRSTGIFGFLSVIFRPFLSSLIFLSKLIFA